MHVIDQRCKPTYLCSPVVQAVVACMYSATMIELMLTLSYRDAQIPAGELKLSFGVLHCDGTRGTLRRSPSRGHTDTLAGQP